METQTKPRKLCRKVRAVTFSAGDENVLVKPKAEYYENKRNSTKLPSERQYVIRIYGIDEHGGTYGIRVLGFKPYLFAKVQEDWGSEELKDFLEFLNACMDTGNRKGGTDSQTRVVGEFKHRETLCGFDNGRLHKFVKLSFNRESDYNTVKSRWSQWGLSKRERAHAARGLTPHHRTMHYGGKMGGGDVDEEDRGKGKGDIVLYDAQLPPLIKYMHVHNISPSGWFRIERLHSIVLNKTTTCKYEFDVTKDKLIPFELDKPTPYKVMSFDIEASSSHGDFPTPSKTYRKFAEEVADLKEERDEVTQGLFYDAIEQALCDIDHGLPVSKIYTKTAPPQLDELRRKVSSFLEADPTRFQSFDLTGEESVSHLQEDDEQEFRRKTGMYREGCVADMLADQEVPRDKLINELDRMLQEPSLKFPKVAGDEVTYIGSTFYRFGESEPYLNHCLTVGDCATPDVENVEIECVRSEKRLLQSWSSLIAREDPDVIIGYNIFGFDWPFIHGRVKEVFPFRSKGVRSQTHANGTSKPTIDKTVEGFYERMSRQYGAPCLKYERSTGLGLFTTNIQLASGQHDMKYPKIPGRIQIDLYPVFRRDFQLEQYKLDSVAAHFIGDFVTSLEISEQSTKVFSSNLSGLKVGDYVTFETHTHTVDRHNNGEKFPVMAIDGSEASFTVRGEVDMDLSVPTRWALGKDDVSPQDIFRLSNGDREERGAVAKYCIQDCRLVLDLILKVDTMTNFIEMSSLCSVPIDYLVTRGQGIKLTSYLAKKCRGWASGGMLMPTQVQDNDNPEAYEGAIVLEPKRGMYLDEAVACVDFSSLYPSCMMSENISPDSKVSASQYDTDGNLVASIEYGDVTDLEGMEYVDIRYDTYEMKAKSSRPGAAKERVCTGYRICRYAQYPEGRRARIPAVLAELLAERKRVRKLIKTESDPFMRNILDKRQLSIKVTANSLYGGCGAKTSHFYDIDCAASTTAMGRKLLGYARRVIEDGFSNTVMNTKAFGDVEVNPEYVYGDTDSVFFKLNPVSVQTGKRITHADALKVTLELAPRIGEEATKWLKAPHDLEYEKTFWPFILLSKKRYAGVLYEHDPNKGKRKSMGIVLNRRDNAPVVKDVYGGVLDILLTEQNVTRAVEFMTSALTNLVAGDYPFDKLVLTKSLRSGYQNPNRIAHNVLAKRIATRAPGSEPKPGDRVAFVYVETKNKKALQGDRIETPEYVRDNGLSVDYRFYVTNQIMKPMQQIFALVLEKIHAFRLAKGAGRLPKWQEQLRMLREKYPDRDEYEHKLDLLRAREVKNHLFNPVLEQ